MQAESIVVIVAVSLLILYVITSTVTTRKRGIVTSWIPFILVFVGVLFLILVILGGQEIKPYHWAEVLVLIGLLLVTAVYADSTAKMAEETKKQRYDVVRPVLDIQRQLPDEMDKMTRVRETLTDELNLENIGLSCVICNIGLGPAIDTYSFIQSQKEESIRYDFGVIAVGDKTIPINMSIKLDKDSKFLVVYYKDIYGRSLKSERAVLNKDNKWILGSLKIDLYEEDEKNN